MQFVLVNSATATIHSECVYVQLFSIHSECASFWLNILLSSEKIKKNKKKILSERVIYSVVDVSAANGDNN